MSNRSHARARSKPRHVLPALEPDLKQPARPLIDLSEARKKASTANSQRAFSLAWDENEALGITPDMRRSGPGMLSDQERKETLYKAYLNNVWISACVDVIAKRITSGGSIIEEVEQGKGNEANRAQIQQLLGFVNEDDDFLQLTRAIITDILIYGEAYMEVVYKAGKPFSLHKIDCITMNYKLDQHGHVLQYIQNMTHSTDTITFQPEEIIRWWLPDPQAHQKALSPIERILGSVDADTRMSDWARQFFRKGARPNFWIKFPGPKPEAERFVTYLRENYTGQANAHVPLVLFDDAELYEIGKGSIDVDFVKGREMMRQEILAGYQVPPAIVSQIESGNIGGGTGESQDKSFQFNACDPVKQLFFEKFNYRILQKGFGITDWKVNSRYAEFRSDDLVSKVQDTRIRNGSSTINEVRAEMGRKAIPGGDTALFAVSKEVIPVERLDEMADEQAQQAQIGLQTAQATADLAKVKADQAKNPPKPPPSIPGVNGMPGPDLKQPGQPGQQPPQLQAAQGKQQQPGLPGLPPALSGQQKQAKESANHTGVMVAFMLSPDIASTLALPGGEPADELHCTLTYLGDADEWTPAQQQGMQRVVSSFAGSHPPVAGRLSGGAQFNAPQGQPEPIVALIDAPDLPAFRQALVHALADAGYETDKQHGYTAHLTLKYANSADETPVPRIASTPLLFDRLLLAIGGQQYIYLLSGTKQEERFRRVTPDQRLKRLLREDDGPSPATVGMVSRQGSCNCEVCRANAGQPVEHPPPYHDGCDCSLEAQEASDPKAPAASASRNGGVLVASR